MLGSGLWADSNAAASHGHAVAHPLLGPAGSSFLQRTEGLGAGRLQANGDPRGRGRLDAIDAACRSRLLSPCTASNAIVRADAPAMRSRSKEPSSIRKPEVH